jgi:hypothetical protein
MGERLCREVVVQLEDVKVTGDRFGQLGRDPDVSTVSGMRIEGRQDIQNPRGTEVRADFLRKGVIRDWAGGSVCWIRGMIRRCS